MEQYREVIGYDGKYVLSADGTMKNTITGEILQPKVYGRMKSPGYRLYRNCRGTVKSVRSWVRLTFPEVRKKGYRDVVGYEGLYGISRDGAVYSYNTGNILTPNESVTSPYLYVSLTKDNVTKHRSIHRLVAEAYVPNPGGLPEVDHINRHIHDNSAENLRWVSRKENLENTEMGFTRNFRRCTLFHDGKYIGWFNSINDASRCAAEVFGASYSGMNRNLHSRGCEIKSGTTSPLGRRVG